MSDQLQIPPGGWLFWNRDPVTGVAVWIGEVDGHYVIRRDIPMDDILESCADERAYNQGKSWGDGQVIGSVPMGLAFSSGYVEAKKQGDTAWIKRFWNDPDHKKLRTREGRV